MGALRPFRILWCWCHWEGMYWKKVHLFVPVPVPVPVPSFTHHHHTSCPPLTSADRVAPTTWWRGPAHLPQCPGLCSQPPPPGRLLLLRSHCTGGKTVIATLMTWGWLIFDGEFRLNIRLWSLNIPTTIYIPLYIPLYICHYIYHYIYTTIYIPLYIPLYIYHYIYHYVYTTIYIPLYIPLYLTGFGFGVWKYRRHEALPSSQAITERPCRVALPNLYARCITLI